MSSSYNQIVEYFEGKSEINCGEFYYNDENEIKNFALHLTYKLKEKYNENFILIRCTDKKLTAIINNKYYECFISMSGTEGVDFWGYWWSVVEIDDL